MTNLDSVSKSRDITLLTKVCIVKAMVFPVVMYGCELNYKEGWVPKNWCFWTVIWRRLLRVPWTSKEIKVVYPKGDQYWIFIRRADAEAPINWCKEPTPYKRPWYWERLRAGEGGSRGWDGWYHWLSEHEFEHAPELVKDSEAWRAAVHGIAKSWTQLKQLNNSNKIIECLRVKLYLQTEIMQEPSEDIFRS